MSNSLPYDVVLLPNESLSRSALKASATLSSLESLFTLDNINFYAHASLYMLQLESDVLELVTDKLAAIARAASPISMQATNYVQSDLFIDVGYAQKDTFEKLKMDVISALNPIRSDMRAKDKERMKTATGVALENYRKYGYKYVGELSRPHITFTRFDSDRPTAINLLPDVTTFSGVFDRLGLFEMGDNGTCIRKITEWKLA